MNDSELQANVTKVTDILLSAPDEIGLHEVRSDVQYDLRISDDAEIRRVTLAVVREMLKRGARVDFDLGVPTGKSHPETTPDEIVARIEREWTALGRRLTIGDICHFEWTPAAMEAYEMSKLGRPPS
jgi:hypothetical protein